MMVGTLIGESAGTVSAWSCCVVGVLWRKGQASTLLRVADQIPNVLWHLFAFIHFNLPLNKLAVDGCKLGKRDDSSAAACLC